jgi:hypothetical protein
VENTRTDGKFLPSKSFVKVLGLNTNSRRNHLSNTNKSGRIYKTVGCFAKTFGNTKSVVEYLGRYTHKIAISNQRIKSIDGQM